MAVRVLTNIMPLWYYISHTFPLWGVVSTHYTPLRDECEFFSYHKGTQKRNNMAISSIHFASGHSGYFDHNSRESHTNNAIFSDEENYCSATKSEAFEVFKQELKTRTEAYENRTGQKLQKNTQTHISAIFNFNKDTTPEQAHKVCEYLEKVLDTKVVQLAMHRDEGHIIEDDNQDMHDALKVDNAIKNYHGHIEMLGLDSQGYSIRKKLDKPMLREIQTEVAKILGMERGRVTSYSKEEYQKITNELKPQNEYENKKAYNKAFSEKAKELGLAKERKSKRLDTYEYKEMAKQRGEAVKEFQKEIIKLKEENQALKAENKDLKIDNEALKYSKKELEEEIKNLSKNLREALKELGALRPHYAELENLNKELKEELKNELLNHEKIVKSYQDLEKKLREELTKKDEKINDLEVENKDLKTEIEALKYQLDLKEKRSQSYFGLNQELKSEIIALKSQINDLEEQKEDLEEKVIDLEEKINPRANTDDFDFEELQTRIKSSRERAETPDKSDSSSFNKIKKVQEESKSSSIERYNDLKAYVKSTKLSAKFDEIDKKSELEQSNEAPAKKQSKGRER